MINEFSCGISAVDLKQTLYYLGVKGEAEESLKRLLCESEREILSVISPKAVYSVFDYCVECEQNGELNLQFAKVKSKSLCKNLKGCKKIALFTATVGTGVDRLILKYQKISPAKATVLQAMGSALIEQFCDSLNAFLISEYNAVKPRFSCGYGDLDISLQRDIFAALSVEKRLGITLLDNFFMTPTKSVTAIVGIL
ncbi:MAG: Vitamin B12 dependent methionine synthase activation subunit [Clostridia bacterium]|nr:Vitamin B12 dependent methionine synthase activation subunit [Clostridia bacterium]